MSTIMSMANMAIIISPKWWSTILLIVPFIISCGQSPSEQHKHGTHTDHEGHSEHADDLMLLYTNFTDQTELFVEFPPLVAHQASVFTAYITRLSDFKPLTEGTLDVLFLRDQKTVARFRVKEPVRGGIFRPEVVPREAGVFDLVIQFASESINVSHQLGSVEVFSDQASAASDRTQASTDTEITYLKEQQWGSPFALTPVKEIPMRASVPGTATVYASEAAEIGNLVGYLQSSSKKEEDYGEALVVLEKARGDAELAQQEMQRLKSLYQAGAIPEKRLFEASKARDVAVVALKVAKARLQHHAPDTENKERTKRWLHIRVPEYSAAQLQQVSGAWFNYADRLHVLDRNNGTRVVKVGSAVDPVSRTVPVVLEYPADKGPALIGVNLTAHVYTQVPALKIAMPSSAVIDDGGRSVVYVQISGESFTRRVVELGIQDGPWVEVLSGVQAGERVVSAGAYYVKLASVGGEEIGHGHAH